MKTYFQIQGVKKLRVYRIVVDEMAEKKRTQKTLAVLSVDEKVPDELLEQLSEDDKMRLADTFDLLKSQIDYERVRDTLVTLPPILDKASALLASGRLSLSNTQKNDLREKMAHFLKQLK